MTATVQLGLLTLIENLMNARHDNVYILEIKEIQASLENNRAENRKQKTELII